MKQQAVEATVASLANKVTYGGGSVALIGGYTANEIAAFGGLIIAAIGLVVQVVFKRRSDKREQLFHDARMRGFKLPGDPE